MILEKIETLTVNSDIFISREMKMRFECKKMDAISEEGSLKILSFL